MNNEKEKKIEKTVNILKQLDETSLLLVVSGAELLAARQKMDKQRETQEA